MANSDNKAALNSFMKKTKNNNFDEENLENELNQNSNKKSDTSGDTGDTTDSEGENNSIIEDLSQDNSQDKDIKEELKDKIITRAGRKALFQTMEIPDRGFSPSELYRLREEQEDKRNNVGVEDTIIRVHGTLNRGFISNLESDTGLNIMYDMKLPSGKSFSFFLNGGDSLDKFIDGINQNLRENPLGYSTADLAVINQLIEAKSSGNLFQKITEFQSRFGTVDPSDNRVKAKYDFIANEKYTATKFDQNNINDVKNQEETTVAPEFSSDTNSNQDLISESSSINNDIENNNLSIGKDLYTQFQTETNEKDFGRFVKWISVKYPNIQEVLDNTEFDEKFRDGNMLLMNLVNCLKLSLKQIKVH